MSVESYHLSVGTLDVAVVRKAVRNLHVGVYPPEGAVRVAAPVDMSRDAIRTAVLLRLGWIRRQVATFAAQRREPPRDFVSGETHWFMGRQYRLRVLEGRRARVRLDGGDYIELSAPDLADRDHLARTLDGWLRRELRARAEPLVDCWAARLDANRPILGIKRMRTRWGTCNSVAGRVWLNLALARVAPPAIEYVVAHEVAHLLVRNHGADFVALLDLHLPAWRAARDMLTEVPYPEMSEAGEIASA